RSQEAGEKPGTGIQDPGTSIRDVVRAVMEELGDRQSLEKKVNELMAENQRARAAAEAAEKSAAGRAGLRRVGGGKIDLAYRAVKEEVKELAGAELRDYVEQFVGENPELLPARLTGGSGASGGHREMESGDLDLSRIRPGMSAEEMDRARREVARVA